MYCYINRKATFQRYIRDVVVPNILEERTYKSCGDGVRFQSEALLAIQEFTEAFLVRCYEKSNMCALHARRVTVKPSDLRLYLHCIDYEGYSDYSPEHSPFSSRRRK